MEADSFSPDDSLGEDDLWFEIGQDSEPTSVVDPVTAFPNEVFEDRYRIDRFLHRKAGSALVAFAYDTVNDLEVFIKARQAGTSQVTRLEREADVLESLSHPQIPQLYGADLEAQYPYLVLEKKPNQTSAVMDWLACHPVNFATLSAQIVRSALDPLGHMHERDMTHRDVKPDNLAMQHEGPTSLLDPEIALMKDDKTADQIYKNAHEKSQHITEVGRVVGTMQYLAPEQVEKGYDATPSTDIFATGIVLYHMLLGKYPFAGTDIAEIAISRMSRHEGPGFLNGRDIPEALQAVAERAIADWPAERYESAGEMAEDLDKFLVDSGSKA